MAEYIDRKRYMKDKYNCDLLMIEGVELVPLYQIIDRLEQQSCEDAIYRQAAIRLAEQGQVQGFEWQIRKLTTLSSVTPTRKVGKWIKDYDNSALDGLYHCSVCNRKLWILKEQSVSDYPYCHCGAEMRGAEDEEN